MAMEIYKKNLLAKILLNNEESSSNSSSDEEEMFLSIFMQENEREIINKVQNFVEEVVNNYSDKEVSLFHLCYLHK